MIERKIVFVLGAGASKPYGLPLGCDLRKTLCEATESSAIARVLREKGGISETDTAHFAKAFLQSARDSIDAFLATRSDFREIGKLAIALEICFRELPEKVFTTNNDDDWYRRIWNVMVDEIHHVDDLSNNAVRFVTFNYDRSLEFFLHHATKSTFNVSDDAIACRAWSRLPILHVYGSVGSFSFPQGAQHRSYGAVIDWKSLKIAADGIKIIPESREGDQDFQTAKEWFKWANAIVFLGFGFDTLNVRRLDVRGVLRNRQDSGTGRPTIFASAFERTPAERDLIKAQLCPSDTWYPLDYRNLDTLRHSGLF